LQLYVIFNIFLQNSIHLYCYGITIRIQNATGSWFLFFYYLRLMIPVIIAYVALLALVSVLSYRGGFRNVFSTEKRLPWFMAGFSLFMINPDTINIISKMGIVADQGYAGLWIFYTGVLGAGFMPVIFAPLWSRLRFMTDNQFILLRFSGRPAKILHLFRAVYVGYLVVVLFIAQVFIGLSKLLTAFFDITYSESFLVISGILVVLIAKNSLRLKVRTDFLNGIIYLLAFTLGGILVVRHFGGMEHIYSRLNSDFAGQVRLFPEGIAQTSFETLPTLLVYFFIQWWSVNVLDGAGPEAQRFMNIRDPFGAFKAAFLPLVLFSTVFLFHSFVLDTGILAFHDNPGMVPLSGAAPDHEAGLLTLYRQAMPGALGGLIFLAFLAGFVAFLESFINWGSGFVMVDGIKTYLFRNASDRQYTLLSYAVMLLIGFTGIAIAWYNTHLLGLQKFIFAMGAGVGPVFILRWFWWRINAWSQLTAMVSSLVFAVSWDVLLSGSAVFEQFVHTQVTLLHMSPYAFKLLSLTVLVTLSWLVVTFLTRPDDPAVLAEFTRQVKPGGWWREYSPGRSRERRQPWGLLLVYPVISILPLLLIWQFKFGNVLLALVMLAVWIGLMILTVRRMARWGK